VKGVISADDGEGSLTIIFDDAVASIEAIKEALKKSGYPSEGEAEYLTP